MTTAPALVYGFPESADAAARLAAAMRIPFAEVQVHHFPDGESLVRLDPLAKTAILYRSLDRPNEKLIELLFAASVLREAGAIQLILVAPYMCYMRQDVAFLPGQAVSQRIIGEFLAGLFDVVVTVDPHLHRTRHIKDVFPNVTAVSLSAAPLLGQKLQADGFGEDTLVVGPDEESRQWVEAIASPLGLDVLVGRKKRRGDRDVRIDIPGIDRVAGRPVVLVDDVVSSGSTLIECAKALSVAGATRIEALVVHALGGPDELAGMKSAGISRISSTDSVPGPTNVVHLGPHLAGILKQYL